MTEIVQPKMRTVRVSDLHPFGRNPRQISDGALEGLDRSLHKFGLVEPIVWNERTGRVVGGHQRLKILLEAGAEETDVVVVDLTDDDEKALNIVLNNPATAGEYDDQLEGLLDEIEAYIGDDFEALRLDELLEPMAPATEDVPPPLPDGEPKCKLGDVIELGPHRLVVGDSTDREVVAALMQGALASMVFTDPPYGVEIVGGSHALSPAERKRRGGKVIENDALGDEGTRELVRDAALAWPLRPGGSFYVCSPSLRHAAFELALKDADYQLRQVIVWVKDRFVMGRWDYHWRHEPILYGWRSGAAHYFVDDRTLDTVWECPRPSASKDHPTMKPVELIARAVLNSSKPGDLVFDGFAGSGSLLSACHQTGRVFRGIELDPRYADVIVARWAAPQK